MNKAARIRAAAGANIRESIEMPGPATVKLPDFGAPVGPRLRRDETGYLIPLAWIERDPDQPRREFSESSIEALAHSLRESGQLQPCVVRPGKERERYVLVCGERRWRAASVAGLESLRCRVEVGRDLVEIEADQIAENVQREDLAPMDLARALGRQLKARDCSQRELADRLGMSQSAVSKALELLDLPKPVRALVESGELPPSTAREIAKLPDAPGQVKLAREAAGGQLSRGETAAIVAAARAPVIPRESNSPVLGDPSEWSGLIPRESTPGTPSATPIAPAVIPGESSPGADRTPVAAPAPSVLVGAAGAKPGAATMEVLWGCDVLKATATVSVALDPGVPRSAVLAALREAAEVFQSEQSGASRWKRGMQVRIACEGAHPMEGRIGEVLGPGFGGKVSVRFPGVKTGSSVKWECSPHELADMSRRAKPAKKDRGRP